MPTIGGINAGWDNTQPADTENAGLGDDRIRSMKTSVQQALDAEHNFPSGGGANTGYHVLGSARPYYGLQSAVSSSGSDGRLMLTSDTSRLFGVGSGGTVLLGGWGSLSVDTTTGITWPQRAYWALEFGLASSDANGRLQVTFPNSGFSGVPLTQITGRNGTNLVVANIDPVGASGSQFSAFVGDMAGVAVASASCAWFSIGSRTL